MSFAATTPEKTSTAPTERSMPAVMITKVRPTATTSRTAASVAMLRALLTSRNSSGCRNEKTAISPTRIRAIAVLWPVTRRCHHGSRSSSSSSSAATSSVGVGGVATP